MKKSTLWHNLASPDAPQHNSKHPITKKYWNQFTESWCSKKSKKKLATKPSVAVYDFYYYPLSAIKEQFGPKTYVRVAVFLSKQYRKHFNGYSYTDWDFVYWDYRKLELYLGSSFKQILEHLKADKYISVKKVATTYNKNKSSTYLKLNPSFADCGSPAYITTHLTDHRLQRSLIKHYSAALKERKDILKNIERTLDRTDLKINNLQKNIDSIWNRKLKSLMCTQHNPYASAVERRKATATLNDTSNAKMEHFHILSRYYSNLQDALQLQDIERRVEYNISVSKFGKRISHLFSNTPREMRQHITIDGTPVVEVDIAASQPTFLYVILVKWHRSKYRKLADAPQCFTENFEAIAKSGRDFYRYMTYKMKGIKYVNDNKSRDEMKALFCRLVFGNPVHSLSGVDKKEVVTKAFGSSFFQFLTSVSQQDLNNSAFKKHYKNLAHILQTEESKFLMGVMERLAKQNIHFLPLYDSLVVKQSDRDTAVAAFEAEAAQWGFSGIIKTK